MLQNGVVALWGPTPCRCGSGRGGDRAARARSFTQQHLVIIGTVAATVALLYLFLTAAGSAPPCAPPARTRCSGVVGRRHQPHLPAPPSRSPGALAALGGALLGPLFLIFPQMGDLPLLKALTAIVLRRHGRRAGAVIGGLAIGIVESVSTLFIPTDFSRHRGVLAADPHLADPALGTVRRARAWRA